MWRSCETEKENLCAEMEIIMKKIAIGSDHGGFELKQKAPNRSEKNAGRIDCFKNLIIIY